MITYIIILSTVYIITVLILYYFQYLILKESKNVNFWTVIKSCDWCIYIPVANTVAVIIGTIEIILSKLGI